MRETVAQKGDRYLAEGRIVVIGVDRHHVAARARGAGQVYAVEWSPGAGWSCSCPHIARADCSHLLAVKKIVAVDVDARER